MKIYAKLKLERDTVENLIVAYFRDFNPKSSMDIEDDCVTLEIDFEDSPPMGIVEAISTCDIISLKYEGITGKEFDDVANGEKTDAFGISKAKAHMLKERAEKNSHISAELTNNASVGFMENSYKQGDVSSVPGTLNGELSELTEIAKKSSNYEEFASNVAATLRIKGGRRELFTKIIVTMPIRSKWKEISETMGCGANEQRVFSNRVSRFLKQNGYNDIKFMKFLNILWSYRSYFVTSDVGTNPANHYENEKVPKEDEVKEKAFIRKGNLSIKCFSEIPWFDRDVKQIDVNKPESEQIRDIYNMMGINEDRFEKVREDIISRSIKAVKTEFEGDLDEFLENVLSENDPDLIMRLNFSEFINTFGKAHGINKEIKVIDFLKDLREFFK